MVTATDNHRQLKEYGVVHRALIPEAIRDISQYANNRAEQWMKR